MDGIRIYDMSGKESGTVSLDLPIKQKELNPTAFSTAIRVLRQNWRQGTVGVKARGEVAFSGKKPWKQKGTGRARAGTISSPLWRKGGVIFGPQPRTRKLTITKKQKALVFNNVLYSVHGQGNINCLDMKSDMQKPSTKVAAQALKAAGFAGKKLLVFLEQGDALNFASFRNIPKVHILFYDQPNTFDLVNNANWLFLKKDVDLFKQMVSKWN